MGGAASLIFKSQDGGNTWTSQSLDIQGNSSSSGLFSIDFVENNDGVVVGGNYEGDNSTTAKGANAAVTMDGGGQSWKRKTVRVSFYILAY
jgi:photosystem II stability/assembly factor-like uncharacterized protein